MSAPKRLSLASFFRIRPQTTLSKSPPTQPTTSNLPQHMPKRKNTESARSPPRKMIDRDEDWGYFRRRAEEPTDPLILVAFYEGRGTDASGRSLEEILKWGVGKLEDRHDYIQTLFPLPEKSGIVDRAPIINRKVFNAFRERPELRGRLRDAFKKMLWFYGFELVEEEGKVAVKPGPNNEEHAQLWNTRFDHNHLRITRIIRSLRVLGLEKEALAFYDTISCASDVSARSKVYWGRAAHRQLNLAPDLGEREANVDDERIGPKFLWEWEMQRRELEGVLEESRVEVETEKAIKESEGEAKEGKTEEALETLKERSAETKDVKENEESTTSEAESKPEDTANETNQSHENSEPTDSEVKKEKRYDSVNDERHVA